MSRSRWSILAVAFSWCVACGPDEPHETSEPGWSDADGDGVSDAQEASDGTDPNDPSSALSWHPELTARPRLLLDPADLSDLVASLDRSDEPWTTLRARLESRCSDEEQTADEDLSSATTNGNIAVACAVLFAAGNLPAGDKAALILDNWPSDVIVPPELVDKVDLHAGQGLLQAARAWDLLLGVGYPEGRDPLVAEERLHAFAADLWDFYVEDYPVFLAFARNNHSTKLISSWAALGFAANDDERSARYVNLAADQLPRLNDALLAEDGGYAEGPSYLVYGGQSVLPWLAAFDRWLGDGELLAKPNCQLSLDADCTEELIGVTSPLRDPRVCAGFDRFVEMLMPAGYGPNIDDGNLATAPLGVTAGLCDSAVQSWGWSWQAVPWASSGSVDLSADALVHWPRAPVAVEPVAGPLVLEGYAVLRDRWDRNGAYALLEAEAGVLRAGGGLHEQPDGLAFLWATRGEYLLLDSGYGSWEQREQVNQPEAHNVILVDGEGSGAVDAEVLETYTDGPFQVARGTVTFGGVRWTRTLVLASDSALVVRDVTESVDGASHDLLLNLHGANDTLSFAADVAQWHVGDLDLSAAVIADVPLSYSTRVGEHALHHGQIEVHGIVEAGARSSATVTWLTVAVADGSELALDGDSLRWDGGYASLDGEVQLNASSLTLP